MESTKAYISLTSVQPARCRRPSSSPHPHPRVGSVGRLRLRIGQSNGPTRHRSHPTAVPTGVRPYERTLKPARQRDRANWRHGSPDGHADGLRSDGSAAMAENRDKSLFPWYRLQVCWKVCLGGSGEPSGVVRRPRQRPHRPVDGPDGHKCLHINHRWKGRG